MSTLLIFFILLLLVAASQKVRLLFLLMWPVRILILINSYALLFLVYCYMRILDPVRFNSILLALSFHPDDKSNLFENLVTAIVDSKEHIESRSEHAKQAIAFKQQLNKSADMERKTS